jgi:RNA polymerase sigma-70 factor (ECF subfamily)
VAASSVESIAGLYADHHGWLKGWLRKKLNCSDTAADLAQDTFLRVVAAPEADAKVRAIETPRSYLVTIAQRVMVDYFRRRTFERAYLEALSGMPEAVQISPESQALVIETICQIDAMLDGLGSKAKQAFLLSQIEGLGYQEIADRLGVSVSSVKKYMARAIEQCLLLALEAEL